MSNDNKKPMGLPDLLEGERQNPYSSRMIGNNKQLDGGTVSTVRVFDGQRPYETLIASPDYHNDVSGLSDATIAEAYDTPKRGEIWPRAVGLLVRKWSVAGSACRLRQCYERIRSHDRPGNSEEGKVTRVQPVIRALLDWFIRRRNPYRVELRELCQERIEIDEFRRRCMARWVENNGPVPEGRILVVGVLNGSLRVGPTERLPGDDLGGSIWKFKSLAGVKPGDDVTG